MGRIRTIKPKLFTHEGLYDAEHETGLPLRIAFAGLFTECDREGRFQWRPRTLKAAILPFDELDFSRVLHALSTRGFILKYTASNGDELGVIPTFKHHQQINNREADSELEAPNEALLKQWFANAYRTREARVKHVIRGEGKGKEGKGREGEKRSLRSQQPRVRAREGPKAAQSSTALAAAMPEQASDVLDAGDAGKLAGALRYAGFAATPSNPKVREAAMHGVSEVTLALAIPKAIADKQAEGEGKKPTVPFVIAIAERMHAEGLDAGDGCACNVKAMPMRTNGQGSDFDSLGKGRDRVSVGLVRETSKAAGSDVIDMGKVQEIRDDTKHS